MSTGQNREFITTFTSRSNVSGSSDYKKDDDISKTYSFDWFISADKIFESEIEGFKEYAKFYSMEFSLSRFSLFDGMKSSDSALCAKDIKIYMAPSRFCAGIQSSLASGKEISKISIKKVITSGTLEPIEEKEFSKCIVQSFARIGEVVSFTFRCTSYSESYQDFKSDGTKFGKTAIKADLTTWEIE